MQTLKLVFLLAGWLVFSNFSKAPEPVEKTQWLTLAQAMEKMKIEKRPILIDLYTDWCGWCKVMDKKTYTNKNVSQYLAENSIL